ncbi:Uncharacterised protein [Candidatus Burarchaeum australiense]|nr:Uncharacterised protein [Candidatus Burarchaeum australiense]
MEEQTEEKEFSAWLDEHFPSKADLSEVLQDKRSGEKEAERPRQKKNDFGKRPADFRKFFESMVKWEEDRQERFVVWVSKHQPKRLYVMIRVAVGSLDCKDCLDGKEWRDTLRFLRIIATNRQVEMEHKHALARFVVGGALKNEPSRRRATGLLFSMRPMGTSVTHLAAGLMSEDKNGEHVRCVRMILDGLRPSEFVGKKLVEEAVNADRHEGDDALLNRRRKVIFKFLEKHMAPTDYAAPLAEALLKPATEKFAVGIFLRMDQSVAESALRLRASEDGPVAEKAGMLLAQIETRRQAPRQRDMNLVPLSRAMRQTSGARQSVN